MTDQTINKMQLTMPSDCEIRLTREFDAPRELVWEAITKPEHVVHWYGCGAMSMTVCEIDLRVGGKWRYVLHNPDDRDYGFNGEYREIVQPEIIVSTECFEDFPDNPSLVTVTLETLPGNRVRLVSNSRYDSAETAKMVLGTGMEHGAAESYDRLEARLAQMAGTAE